MLRFLIVRSLQTLLVLIAITIVVFLMLHLAPGDPLATVLGPNYGRVSPERKAELRHSLGLDLPIWQQYLTWLRRALAGDLGRSLVRNEEVFPLVVRRFRATATLALGALLLAVPVGATAGISAGVRKGSTADRLISTVATAGYCAPVFFLGQLLIALFALQLGWLPAFGMHSPAGGGIADLVSHLILPSASLSAGATAFIARMTRSRFIEIMSEDYIRTARAKGLAEHRVIWVHALRNVMVSVVTVLGLEVAFLLGGAVVVEVVFAWPGIGSLMWQAILQRDFPVIQGAVLLVAATYAGVNFLVDLLYAWIDPRIDIRY